MIGEKEDVKVNDYFVSGGEMMRSSTEQMDKINTIVHDSVAKMQHLNE